MNPAIVETAALTIDCADAAAMGVFYRAAGGGEVTFSDEESCGVTLGGLLLIFRALPDYRPPIWPGSGSPMQMHFEFNVDGDLDEAAARLVALGATLAEFQPHDNGRVMFDPAGHPFCIGAPV
ncbi:VOC family protein [Actinospica durhamensis]|uniref:VOC family protein n=1 Tax=Actinospica durhamensis TaxID=1508375 RepID=A0A941EMA6_9ACTN|nr:VOC family protein [Actinospica durhamensis]MBR7833513.1 VOC family protein [Actinospica durhamensis]